ncbi:MAG TPA: hypothetical protein VK880_14095 [Anaerolineales bacterium]|nr:hypothetical protein [Anaerolineales bacterium]
MNKKKRVFIIAVIVVILPLILLGSLFINNTVQGYRREAERLASFEGIHSTFSYTRVLATETWTLPFLVHKPVTTRFALWSKAVVGSFDLSILDANGKPIHVWQGSDLEDSQEIQLPRGAYTAKLVFTAYTGELKFGLNGAVFVPTLSEDHYHLIAADPSAGFHWEYLLYTPKNVTSPYLLVVPNNTGHEDDDMTIHQASAKQLIKNMSNLADDLGSPLLVPVFPRPAGDLVEYYTHNLDRNALFMTEDGYQRLDLQLLAMVDDARLKLAEQQIPIDQRFLLWGFSASGTFSDRFSLLYPDRLVAVASAGSHSLPFATYAGENLPYPIGTYDYEIITGAPFDIDTFAALPRFLYQGDQDHGGYITTDEAVYLADDYFNLFVRSDLEARLASAPIPLITDFEMNPEDETLLKYRIYHGATFVDEFIAIRQIYAEAGLDHTQFKLYHGVGHAITEEMENDVRNFFLQQIH